MCGKRQVELMAGRWLDWDSAPAIVVAGQEARPDPSTAQYSERMCRLQLLLLLLVWTILMIRLSLPGKREMHGKSASSH
jgi:hypothetical protein